MLPKVVTQTLTATRQMEGKLGNPHPNLNSQKGQSARTVLDLWKSACSSMDKCTRENEMPPPALALSIIEGALEPKSHCGECRRELQTLFRITRILASERKIFDGSSGSGTSPTSSTNRLQRIYTSLFRSSSSWLGGCVATYRAAKPSGEAKLVLIWSLFGLIAIFVVASKIKLLSTPVISMPGPPTPLASIFLFLSTLTVVPLLFFGCIVMLAIRGI